MVEEKGAVFRAILLTWCWLQANVSQPIFRCRPPLPLSENSINEILRGHVAVPARLRIQRTPLLSPKLRYLAWKRATAVLCYY